MLSTIQNDRLRVTVSDYGAELQSIILDGTERLWQGDPTAWNGRSPVLFPFVGRIKNGKYTFDGVEYPMPNPHGVAPRSVFSLVSETADSLTYRLTSSEETKVCYPFDFVFDVTYRIEANTLIQTFSVTNTGNREMYYSFGAHPGFLIPPSADSEFSDWYLQFAEGEELNQALLDGMFMSRTVEPCRFAEGNRIALYHEMFADDAFILTGLKNKVFEIKSDKSRNRIVADCSGFDYIAFWKVTDSNANYVCIEPWNGLPSDSKAPEDLTVKRDLRALVPGKAEICPVSYTLE